MLPFIDRSRTSDSVLITKFSIAALCVCAGGGDDITSMCVLDLAGVCLTMQIPDTGLLDTFVPSTGQLKFWLLFIFMSWTLFLKICSLETKSVSICELIVCELDAVVALVGDLNICLFSTVFCLFLFPLLAMH